MVRGAGKDPCSPPDAGSIGTNAVAEAAFKTERLDGGVRMSRWILDSAPPPMYRDLGRFTGEVDRWQIVETRLPTYTDVFAGCAVAGTGAPQGDRSKGIEFHNLNAATPETATTTHYFYAHARNFRIDDAAVDVDAVGGGLELEHVLGGQDLLGPGGAHAHAADDLEERPEPQGITGIEPRTMAKRRVRSELAVLG